MSVAGAIIWGLLEPEAASTAEIGHVVRLQGTTGRSFGVITTLKNDGRRAGEDDRRLVEIRLIGEILASSSNRWRFQRGVSSYPPLDSPIHAGTREELCAIYARPEVSTVRLGTLRNAADLPAFAMTDNLLGKHFAVLGTTGAGKSCAVTVILRAILDACPYGHVIMLDPHNEYATAFQNRAELLNPSNLKLPYWLLNFEEIAAILVNQELPEGAYAEGAILRRAILKARRNFSGEGGSQDHITVDTPVPYRLSELIQVLKDDMGAFNKADSAVALSASDQSRREREQRQALRLHVLELQRPRQHAPDPVADPAHPGRGQAAHDHRHLGRALRDRRRRGLGAVPADLRVRALERSRAAPPLLLVCEEAHRYVPRDDQAGFAPTRRGDLADRQGGPQIRPLACAW